ncbi:hypothetical protein [Halobacteriovorax sp. HLS]|uniref:hypothetical protein n=1 Tax=Halobacteriovorax sp. HLS TaxID=2234000 RepID=UPI000FDAA91D|nr:hypothetical protein [Halobacteriovorax sp. HLS]
MKVIILFIFIFNFSAYSQDAAPSPEKKEDEVVVKKKRLKKFDGKFFTSIGLRLPTDKIYGGNFQFGYFLNKGRVKAFVSALIEHYQFKKSVLIEGNSEDTDLSSAQLGFKAGVVYPLRKGYGLAPFATIGSLKSSVQKDPWLGDRVSAYSLKNILFSEIGIYGYVKSYTLGYHFRYSNSVVSNIDTFISIGVFY